MEYFSTNGCSQSYTNNAAAENMMFARKSSPIKYTANSIGPVLYIKIPSVSLGATKKYSTTNHKQPIPTNSKNLTNPKLKSQVIKKLLYNTPVMNTKEDNKLYVGRNRRMKLPEFKQSSLFMRDVAANVIMCKRYASRNKDKAHSYSFSAGRKIFISKTQNKVERRMPSYVTCVGISKMPIYLTFLKPIVYPKKETCDESIQCEEEEY